MNIGLPLYILHFSSPFIKSKHPNMVFKMNWIVSFSNFHVSTLYNTLMNLLMYLHFPDSELVNQDISRHKLVSLHYSTVFKKKKEKAKSSCPGLCECKERTRHM